VSLAGADAVARAIEAQTLAISSLAEKLEASQTPPAPVEEVKKTPDRVPGKKKSRDSWYYGR
jgi:ribosome-binding protein aMBF1 (putative translation factor)